MTIISALVNKFLLLIGASDVAAVESSSATLMCAFAIVFIVCGALTVCRKRPVLIRYEAYTPASVARASALLGIGDITLGILTVLIGAVKMQQIPLALYIASGAVLAAFIAIETAANCRLEKACHGLTAK